MGTRNIRRLAVPCILLAVLAAVGLELALQPATAAPRGVFGHVVARLGNQLISRFERAHVSAGDHITGVILLGGGLDRPATLLKLARRHPEARLVLSGLSEAEIKLVLAGGIETSRITVDHRPTNTYDNALYSRLLVRPKPGERWLLVTSASHMPRAIGAFRATGFPVEPWPVADTPPDLRRLVKTIGREIAGLIAYRLLGRTQELFPSPRTTGPDGVVSASGSLARAG